MSDLREVLLRLDRIEKRLDALLEDAGLEPTGPVCGHCGSDDVIEDACFGQPARLICRVCTKVTEQEESRG